MSTITTYIMSTITTVRWLRSRITLLLSSLAVVS